MNICLCLENKWNEVADVGVKIWPQEFERRENLNINKEEKVLLRGALKHLKNGKFVVGIDPLGLSHDSTKMGMYISPNFGLVTFFIAKGEPPLDKLAIITSFAKTVKDSIYERLLNSKLLIVQRGNKKSLKFPYSHIVVYPDAKQLSSNSDIPVYDQIKDTILVDFFKPLRKQEKFTGQLIDTMFSNAHSYTKGCLIGEQESKAIFERLAPEYAVVLTEKESVKVATVSNTSNAEMKITGEEIEYKTFFLDDYQVAIVNDMGTGHRVILANPGAGKSVLLLSKAFKYASVYKKSKVLLTCYNNNLADSYNFKKNCADFGSNNNLFVMTFHRLVKKILEEELGRSCFSNIATDEDIQYCIDSVKSDKLKLRFKAIFIDEVQIFDPKYLELCYLLLEKEKDATFLLAGDLNQRVRTSSRRGDVPWKKIGGVKLDFSGRVKYIEKNYRNSKQIGEYLRGMLCFMNSKMEMMEMPIASEFEYNSFTISDRKGLALKIKIGIQRNNIKNEVAKAIKEILNKYQVGYSDIAILFPYKKHTAVWYFILDWIQKALDEEGIPFSVITSSDGNNIKIHFSQATGVILSTIDSSLGLDFKAVILAGLYPYNFIFGDNHKKIQIDTWRTIGNLSDDDKEQVQLQIRKVYTACSRARDILYILSDLDAASPMEDIINMNKW